MGEGRTWDRGLGSDSWLLSQMPPGSWESQWTSELSWHKLPAKHMMLYDVILVSVT